MEGIEMAEAVQGRLNGRILEIESHTLLSNILTPFSSLDLSDEDYGLAMECLLHRWIHMMFADCPEMMDGVLDSVGQFVHEDIADICDGETDYLN